MCWLFLEQNICRFLWLLFWWIDWHATCLYHLLHSGFFHLRGGVTHNYAKEKFRKKTDIFGPKVVFLSVSLHAKYIYMLNCSSRVVAADWPPGHLFSIQIWQRQEWMLAFALRTFSQRCFVQNVTDLICHVSQEFMSCMHVCVWFDFLQESALAAPESVGSRYLRRQLFVCPSHCLPHKVLPYMCQWPSCLV